MKKTVIFLWFLCGLCSWSMGQQKEEALKKIESARIALITKRLDLTPEQAEKFWPLYNEFTKKRNAINRSFKSEKIKLDRPEASPEEKEKLLSLGLDTKQRQLDLEKEYSQKLQKVISTQQVIALRNAEKDFRKMLLDRVAQRRQQQQQRMEQFRERRNERQDRRRN